ncbi:hypothetical protein ACFZCV_17680 [Streptomyces sp. NPDC007920]|uniref:hypothetical protein n=1 Tax=Streptomyces sp. NPDC007920 TaxID=3364794 RepID=UPI0036F1400A
MARHASLSRSTARRTLVAVATAGAALGVGATAASAEILPGGGEGHLLSSLGRADTQSGVRALTGTVGHTTGTVAALKPNPLAGTGVDPLDNGVGTRLADFRPVSSQALTGPVAQAPSVGAVPVVGQALGSVR